MNCVLYINVPGLILLITSVLLCGSENHHDYRVCIMAVPDGSVLTLFLRFSSSKDEDGAPGGETEEPTQQAGTGGQEHLPYAQRPGTSGNQTTD